MHLRACPPRASQPMCPCFPTQAGSPGACVSQQCLFHAAQRACLPAAAELRYYALEQLDFFLAGDPRLPMTVQHMNDSVLELQSWHERLTFGTTTSACYPYMSFLHGCPFCKHAPGAPMPAAHSAASLDLLIGVMRQLTLLWLTAVPWDESAVYYHYMHLAGSYAMPALSQVHHAGEVTDIHQRASTSCHAVPAVGHYFSTWHQHAALALQVYFSPGCLLLQKSQCMNTTSEPSFPGNFVPAQHRWVLS